MQSQLRPKKWKRGTSHRHPPPDPLLFASPLATWIRDLTEEGIEPHPGPRFISKNVNGIKGKGKLYRLLKAIRVESNRDPITAVALQDHRLSPLQKLEINRKAKDQLLLPITAFGPRADNGTHYGGTMILIPYEAIELRDKESIHDACARIATTRKGIKGGRAVRATITVEKQTLNVVSAYAPAKPTAPDTRADFFKKLAKLLTRNTLLGIDANCVPNLQLDVKRDAQASAYDNEGAQELSDTVDRLDLSDVAREFLGSTPFFTSHHIVRGGQQCWTRIDQIYAPHSPDTQWHHIECEDFFPQPATRAELDHSAIEVRMTETKPERGNDLESISESIFDDLAVNNRIASCIQQEIAKADTNTPGGWGVLWENIKSKVKALAVKETKKRKYIESKQLEQKRRLLKVLDQRIRTGNATTDDIHQTQTLKADIKACRKQEYTLHQTLEKEAHNMGKGHDKCTKEFFRPWKPTHSAQHIARMKKADWTDPSAPKFTGEVAQDDKSVLDTLTDYYEALFSKKTINPESVKKCLDTLRDANSKRVLAPTARACDEDITEHEVSDTMRELPLGKSPGPDRLPNKFYKTFSALLAPILAKIFNEARKQGELPPTCLEGLISVLYKKKDREDPRNYRPITLLNNDYKILTRILTKRMNVAVMQFVSPQQNGFVPGGFLPENIMLLKLIQAVIGGSDSDAWFVYLDMEKAFDRSSWVYLTEAMEALGFNSEVSLERDAPDSQSTPVSPDAKPKGFIDFVKLFYSHDHPPTRQINMNGRLGRKFPLASGVAQGCPLSPLLFLCITEALTRLVVNDTRTEGILINGTQHKISQYADDSTLAGRTQNDWDCYEEHITTWCEGTAMSENATKREGQLLGKLNRQKHRAPTGVVNKWAADGESIRALGVPMGNKLDEHDWWLNKYREVKQRIAAWRSIGHMSITGRNLLLQAILYGSIRFWLFSLIIPDTIVRLIESDAYHLIWASNPELFTNEDGTTKRSRAYITKNATYQDQKKGGAGLMHIRSHIKAVYAHWGRRYLHPNAAPWKSIAHMWLKDPYPMGSGQILTSTMGKFYTDVPDQARYLRACIKAFEEIGLKQITATLGPQIQGESIFDNNRFEINIDDDHSAAWSKYIGLKRIHNLINDETNTFFTTSEMREFTHQLAPSHVKDTPAQHEWSDALMSSWETILNSIPNDVKQAALQQHEENDGDYVAFVSQHVSTYYARVETDEGSGDIKYHKQWLDITGSPHDTGEYVTTFQQLVHDKYGVIVWIEKAEEDHHYTHEGTSNDPDEQSPDDEEKPPKNTSAGQQLSPSQYQNSRRLAPGTDTPRRQLQN